MSARGVVVIGNFDGVHLGHQEVLAKARGLVDGPLTVVTFWPHPFAVIAPDQAPKLLTDLTTRIELLKAAGADAVRVVRFNRDVATWSPADFVRLIIDPLNPLGVVVGSNFRFGARAAGDVATLRQLGGTRFWVNSLDLLEIDRVVTCSTLIRSALDQGDVRTAARHLGRPFRIRGVVALGDQRGHKMGFPTANLIVPGELALPQDSVYAGHLTRLDSPTAKPMPAAISVGTNPTFNGEERRVETHVLNRTDLDLYGVEVAIEFTARLRGQIKFPKVETLIEQIRKDIAQANSILTPTVQNP